MNDEEKMIIENDMKMPLLKNYVKLPFLFFGLVFVSAVFLIPTASFASEAAFSKYYRAGASSIGNLGCPMGWTQIDSWSINEGDSADGGGGTHTGLACASSAYTAAFAKYYRTGSPNSFPSCPSGWTTVDTWAVQEGDRNDGGGGWHGGVACASNSYQSAISKYYRERAGGNPGAAWTGNVEQCPTGLWTKIDSWSVYEGDSADGGGGQHDGFACAYTGSNYTKTYTKYYRTGHSAILPPCSVGWNQMDSWSVWEGDQADGGGGVHSGVSCAAPNPVGIIQGFKVKMPGNDSGAVPPAQETVSLDGGNQTAANPYFFRDVSAGNHTASVSVPAGWNVGYTICYNSTGCHGNTPTPGNSATVNVPAGGYADLWWHYSLSTGTVIVKATKDGSPWDSPPLVVDITTPVGRMNVTTDPPDEMRNVPAGTYAVHNVTAPSGAGVTLVDFLPGTAMQNLPSGGTIIFTFNFKTIPPATGTVIVKAIKDGVAWNTSFTVNATYPGFSGNVNIDPEQTIPGAPVGVYTANSVVSPAVSPSVTLSNITPSATQTLNANGTITFTFNFSVASPPSPTLVISPSFANVQVGGTQQFNAIYDPDGSGPQFPQTVTVSSGWSSSNNSVATVSGGLATGQSAGSATITANYGGLTAFATLTVTGASSSSTSLALPVVSFSANPASVTFGQSSQLYWTSTNAASCSASGGWSGSKALSGTQSTGALSQTTSFALSCSNAIGSASGSATVSVEQISPSLSPPDLSVYAPSLNSCGVIRLVWNNVAGEDRYEIERNSGSGFVKIVESDRDTTSFTNTAIAQNVSYSYRIRACNTFGCSAYSNSATGNNQSPSANFIWSPQTPAVNQPTLFTDTSTPFGGATITQRQWTFQDGNPAAVTSTHTATTTRFVNASPEQKSVVLSVTDSLSRICSIAKSVTVSQGTGGDWCELPPDAPPGTPCP